MHNPPVSILFIASRSDIAGGEVYLLNVMRHLDRERFRPLVVVPGEGLFCRALQELKVPTVVIEADYGWLTPPMPWYRLLSSLPLRVARLRQLIRENDISLVHTNSNQILEGALAANLSGVHHIHMAQVEFQPNIPLYEKFPIDPSSFASLMGELSTRVIAVSKQVYETLSPPLPKEQVKLVYNGVDFDLLDTAARANGRCLRDELGIPGDSLLITGIGRLTPDKGFDCLIQAFSALLKQDSVNARLLIVGGEEDRPYAERLRNQVVQAGAEKRVHFLGFRSDIARILAETDVFALSSRREGHPFVLLEAMGSGCASVATRCGGVEDTVRDHETGLLVGIDDSGEMARALAELAHDQELRHRIGAAGKREVRARFGAKESVLQLMDIYEEVLLFPKLMAGSVAVDMFLRVAHEMGTLGLKVTELDERLRQVEHLAHSIRRNPIYNVARKVKQWLRSNGSQPAIQNHSDKRSGSETL